MGMSMVSESPCISKYYIVSSAETIECGRVFKFSVEKKIRLPALAVRCIIINSSGSMMFY